jgi:hypothetical protein
MMYFTSERMCGLVKLIHVHTRMNVYVSVYAHMLESRLKNVRNTCSNVAFFFHAQWKELTNSISLKKNSPAVFDLQI